MTKPTSSEPNHFLPLHPIEFRILMVLIRGPAHGYRMVKEIETQEERAGRIFPGNLYRRVRDLLSRGFIEEVPPPDGLEVDPRRKYYGITRLGEGVAGAEGRRLESLVREAQTLGLISGG